jgi:hypothetical protein
MHFTQENRVSKVIVFDRFGFEVQQPLAARLARLE